MNKLVLSIMFLVIMTGCDQQKDEYNKGADGSTGTNGIQGTTGAQGNTGASGSNGVNGTNGIGTGTVGAKGSSGASGSTGAVGSIGVKGNTGNTGPKGECSLNIIKISFIIKSKECQKVSEHYHATFCDKGISLHKNDHCDYDANTHIIDKDNRVLYVDGVLYIRDNVNDSILDVINFN